MLVWLWKKKAALILALILALLYFEFAWRSWVWLQYGFSASFKFHWLKKLEMGELIRVGFFCFIFNSKPIIHSPFCSYVRDVLGKAEDNFGQSFLCWSLFSKQLFFAFHCKLKINIKIYYFCFLLRISQHFW